MIITYDEHYGRVELRHKSYTEEPYDKIDLDELVELWQNCKWIPCEERLPSVYQKAVTCNKHGEMMVGTYTEFGWVYPCYFERPIAWMPLPTPWRGADDE